MAMNASFSGSATGTASMNVPQTQNTAPVLEFRCLYTQDLRRKQKRWQDGRLKFHTFNKRVMVYDDRSNFVGDTHWREDSEFAEGEELELERSGTLVEVGECVGKRDQDLTELVDKRVKEREERAASKIASPAASIYRTQGTPTPNALKAKSLNALVTPSGHYGRALLPVTSPFEDRQGLAGTQKKHERERPAKRQKPNESVPSKNGYAQNLMGATLSLSSSRPPSTGPIRYEPVRLTPSVPVRPEPIDLTLEGSDESDQGTVHRTEEVRDKTKPSKKPRRSPPAKSGYASNLTGVSLTLSRPESFGAIRPSKLSALRPDVLRNPIMHEISSDDEESFSEPVAPQQPPVAKKAKTPKEVPRPRKPSITPLRSSSPPAKNKKTPMSEKEIRRPKSVTQKSSVLEPAPERPTSALRIKSRSGPRMMMLMERPSSRVLASAEYSGVKRTNSTSVQQLPKPSNDIVLSQATRELNAFCQKQEDRLQARSRGERRNTIKDLDEDNLSSPPINSGIDHQTIDQLLSRRSKPAEQGRMASLTSSNSLEEPVEEQASKKWPQLAREEQHRSQDLSTSNPDNVSLPNTGGNIAAELSSQEIRPRPSIVASSNVENIEHSRVQSPSAGGSGQSVHSSSVHRSDPPTIPPPAQTSTDGSGPDNLKANQRKPKPLPQHVISDIQAATESFRAVLKSSASQQHDLTGVPSRSHEIEQRIENIRPITEVREAIPRMLPPKTFSELLQPPNNEVISQPELPAIEAAPRALIAPAAISLVPSIPPLRRIMNPATRGKSVQTLAANTVDTLNNPLPNIVGPLPPPPRLTSRSETINDRNDVANGLAETEGGPWSREAFDLFDTKLCERIMTMRAANANAANG